MSVVPMVPIGGPKMNRKTNSSRTRFSAPVRVTHKNVQQKADAKQKVFELVERRARDAEYFRKCEAQVRLLNNWSKNRFMHRSLRQVNGPDVQSPRQRNTQRSWSVGDLQSALNEPHLFTMDSKQVPYDVQRELTRDQQASDHIKQRWHEHVQSIKRRLIQHERTRRVGLAVEHAHNELLDHCRILVDLQQQWTVRVQSIHSKLDQLMLTRLARDRLRKRAFLLAQLQSFALTLIGQLQQSSKCSAKSVVMATDKQCATDQMTDTPGDEHGEGQMTDDRQRVQDQQVQLEQVLDNASNMLKRYSRISLRRNSEYSRLFSEEADFVWEAESHEWKREQSACINLVDRLFDAFASVIVQRIKLVVRLYQAHLDRVQRHWNELDQQIELIQHSPPFDRMLGNPMNKLFQSQRTCGTAI